MKLKPFTYCLLLWAASLACVDPYDFRDDAERSFLVVDGRITQIDQYNSLRLTWSTPYGKAPNLSPVDNAEIKLFNSKGEVGAFYNKGDGYYVQNWNGVKGTVGESYYIEIQLGDNVYKSKPETMPVPVIPDSVSIQVGYKEEVNELGNIVSFPNIDVFVSTPINQEGQKNYLKWKTDETFSFSEIKCGPLHVPKTCFARRETSPNLVMLYSGELLGEAYLKEVNVASKQVLNWSEFVQRHFFSVYQYSLTKEAYAYWDKVKKISAPSGNIFDLPPATVRGNIYNENDPDELVVGYFESSSLGIARKYVSPDEMQPFTSKLAKYLYCNSGICCSCLLIYGATHEQPDYWD